MHRALWYAFYQSYMYSNYVVYQAALWRQLDIRPQKVRDP